MMTREQLQKELKKRTKELQGINNQYQAVYGAIQELELLLQTEKNNITKGVRGTEEDEA